MNPHQQRDPAASSLEEAVHELMSPVGASNIRFLEILAELGELIGGPPPAFPDLEPFDPVSFEAVVADVDLRMSFVPADDDTVYLACVFGPLPKQLTLQAAVRLLEINLFLHTHGTSAFCLDPDSGDVICACRLNIEMLSAISLFESMTLLSREALRWRNGCFLGDGPADGSSQPAAFV